MTSSVDSAYPKQSTLTVGLQFTGKIFTAVGKALGIKVTTTTGYNPKSNGIMEQMHRNLNAMLRVAVTDGNQES